MMKNYPISASKILKAWERKRGYYGRMVCSLQAPMAVCIIMISESILIA
jgi:hypothetical protein